MLGRRTIRLIELLYSFASIIMLIFLCVVLIGTLSYWTYTFKLMEHSKLNQKLFSLGIIIALVTILAQWIEGRVNTLIKVFGKGGSDEKEYRGIRRPSRKEIKRRV